MDTSINFPSVDIYIYIYIHNIVKWSFLLGLNRIYFMKTEDERLAPR
jgi:hypothetical protein